MIQTLLILMLATILIAFLFIVLEIKTMTKGCQVLKEEVSEDYERIMRRLESPESWEDVDMHKLRQKKKNDGSSVEIV